MEGLKGGGVGLTLAFKPGFKVDGEYVCRTFQPSYVAAESGALFAFCQGRLRGGRDDDPKLILMSRSDDEGMTWSAPKAVSGQMNHFAVSAYLSGRGCVSVLTLVDLRVTKDLYDGDYAEIKRRTGIDISSAGRRTPMVMCRFDSEDGGKTWEMETLLGGRSPLNRVYQEGTLIMFNPIGQVHIISEGPYTGRYIIGGPATVVPAHKPVSDCFRNHAQSGSGIIYSDDRGKTWHAHGMITDYLANEASAVSINRGERLLLIRRLNDPGMFSNWVPLPDISPGPMQRLAHVSSDCGRTWSRPFLTDISGVRCHGTLSRAGGRLLFSIPAGVEPAGSAGNFAAARRRGAVYFSDDEGSTWRSKIIEAGSFSYSTVGPLSASRHIILFARGTMGQKGVGCRVFNDSWLEESA